MVKDRVGVGGKSMWLEKGNMRDSCADENVIMHLDNIVIMILYHSFERCYQWGTHILEKDVLSTYIQQNAHVQTL